MSGSASKAQPADHLYRATFAAVNTLMKIKGVNDFIQIASNQYDNIERHIDYLSDWIKQAENKVVNTKKDIKDLQSQITQRQNHIKIGLDKMKKLKQDHKSKNKQKQNLVIQHQKLTGKIIFDEKNYQIKQIKQGQKDSLKAQLQNNKYALSQLKKQCEEIQSEIKQFLNIQLKDEASKLQKVLIEKKKQFQKSQKKHKQLQSKLQKLQQSQKKGQEQINKIERQIEKINDQIQNLTKDNQIQQELNSLIESQISGLAKANKQAQKQIQTKKQLLKNKQKQLQESQKQKSKYEKQCKELNKKLTQENKKVEQEKQKLIKLLKKSELEVVEKKINQILKISQSV